MKKVYLTLASVVRDQEHYVREWLTFNHLIGVERMVIVLHKCSDHTEDEIRKLPFFEEKVRLHHVANDEQRVQMGAFRWMLGTYGPSTEWMLFTDADEFFFGTVENDLRTILARHRRREIRPTWAAEGDLGPKYDFGPRSRQGRNVAAWGGKFRDYGPEYRLKATDQNSVAKMVTLQKGEKRCKVVVKFWANMKMF